MTISEIADRLSYCSTRRCGICPHKENPNCVTQLIEEMCVHIREYVAEHPEDEDDMK